MSRARPLRARCSRSAGRRSRPGRAATAPAPGGCAVRWPSAPVGASAMVSSPAVSDPHAVPAAARIVRFRCPEPVPCFHVSLSCWFCTPCDRFLPGRFAPFMDAGRCSRSIANFRQTPQMRHIIYRREPVPGLVDRVSRDSGSSLSPGGSDDPPSLSRDGGRPFCRVWRCVACCTVSAAGGVRCPPRRTGQQGLQATENAGHLFRSWCLHVEIPPARR
jgi:hypothetical protein